MGFLRFVNVEGGRATLQSSEAPVLFVVLAVRFLPSSGCSETWAGSLCFRYCGEDKFCLHKPLWLLEICQVLWEKSFPSWL